MAENDKSIVKSQYPLTRFDPKVRRELVVRGLIALSEERDAGYYFFKGEEHRIRGELDKAISCYGEALKIDDEHEDSLFYRGWCIFNKPGVENYSKAIADFSKVIELNPRHASAYYYRANSYYYYGIFHGFRSIDPFFYDKAVSDFTKAIELNRRTFHTEDCYYYRGLAYFVKGEYDSAISDYSKAIELNPRYVRAYTSRASACHSKGDYGKAISDYTKAIKIAPQYNEAYYNRGKAYSAKGEFDHAISDYSKAIDMNPGDAMANLCREHAYCHRGVAYNSKGEHDKAISDFSKVIQIDPSAAKAYCHRGYTYGLHKREQDKAISDFSKAIEINPKYVSAYFNRACSYYIKKNYVKAWEDVHKAQDMGHRINSWFLKALREVSREGRTL